tara:strand:+ start:1327 stop:2475 length:1149 start_codon:yes stop_codon:yes gene_type:complete
MTNVTLQPAIPFLKRQFVSLPDELKEKYSEQEINNQKRLGSIDKKPDLPKFIDINHKLDTKTAQVALIRGSDAVVDRCYDREVNWSNLNSYITKLGGFSYDSCGIIDVVYDNKKGKFIIVIGQHRVDMGLLCVGDDVEIPAKIYLLDENLSEHEQIKIESIRHHTEANNITPQKAHERGLSGLIADVVENRKYADFITSHDIGVYGQEHLYPNIKFKKICRAPWMVGRAMDLDEDDCSLGLELLRDYLETYTLEGKAIMAVTQYLHYFNDKLEAQAEVISSNKESFVKQVFDYGFNVMGFSSEEWLDGSSMLRGESTVIPVTRLVKITNNYCRSKKMNLSDGRKFTLKSKWCSPDEKVFTSYMDKMKVHNLFRPLVTQQLSM